MTEEEYLEELKNCQEKILNSSAPKKLIVAGPGTGKSTFFKRAIEHYEGARENYLVLTFINNLEKELEKDLGGIANVFTFHAYAHFLLRKNPHLRLGLGDDFYYYPNLIKLVKSDWEILENRESPQFVKLMRNGGSGSDLDFFIRRGNIYNATGFEDSICRVYESLSSGKGFSQKYKLLIVDEYQDFNKLETLTLAEFVKSSPSLIVGDDDQTLYCQLRDSSPEFIRSLFSGSEYENFELPFCLRCPNPVIQSFHKIVENAKKEKLLDGRIDKSFAFFPPIKGKDSKFYPKIKVIMSSIQKKLHMLQIISAGIS